MTAGPHNRTVPTTYDSRRYALSQRWDQRHLTTIRRLLDPRPGERILEVGCGRGHLTKRLQDLGAEAVGIDANPQAADVAIARDIRAMRVEDLAFPDEHFDKVVSVHTIEHVLPLERALAEMARVLRPGGTMLLIYPAEPIRGLFAVPDSIIIHGHPFRARELHVHKLRPGKVRALAESVGGLVHVHSEFDWLSSPQFVTMLRKPG